MCNYICGVDIENEPIMKQNSYTKLQLARLIDRENHMNTYFEGYINY